MAPRTTRIVVVEDRLHYAQLMAEAIVAAFPGHTVAMSLSWSHAESKLEAQATEKPSLIVIPLAHNDALARRSWQGVHTVFVDTHDTSRDWREGLGEHNVAPVWAGAELAGRLVALNPRPRVICYSSYLDNPLVKTLLWQQTGSGKADGYFLASSLADPATVRSAIVDPVPQGQEAPPNAHDFAVAGIDEHAPIFDAVSRAHGQEERWSVLAGILPYTDATSATRKWFQRVGRDLGLDRDGNTQNIGRSTVDFLRRVASGQD